MDRDVAAWASGQVGEISGSSAMAKPHSRTADNTKLARAARAASACQEQKRSIDGVSCKNGAGIVAGQVVEDTKAGQCSPTLTARQMRVTGETRIPLDRPQIIIIGVPQDRGLTFAARYAMRGAGAVSLAGTDGRTAEQHHT